MDVQNPQAASEELESSNATAEAERSQFSSKKLAVDSIQPHSDGLPDPSPVLDLMEAFRRSKTMFAAVALGVFDRLGDASASAADLAERIKADEDALERLLDSCVCLELLHKEDGLYSLEPVAETYLRRSSPHALTGYINYSNDGLYALWANLEDAVREGTNRWQQTFGLEGGIFDHFFKTDEARREFIAGMHGWGQITSSRVASAFDLNRFHRMVDLGGATGHLAMAACERYSELRATIFDLPAVIELAKHYVARSKVADRMDFIAGDFFRDPLPQADLYSLGRIIHDWSEEKIRTLLAKICHALPSGGALLVAESLLDKTRTGPRHALMQSLSMLVCTEGKERSLAEYADLLREAGFAGVEGRRTGAALDAVLATKH